MMKKRKLILLFCFLFAYSIKAQSPRFKHLTVDDGLLQNAINVIAQDKKGFIWLATGKGLNRYDGHRILSFRHDPSNPNSIPADDIYCLYADGDNNLWIGTRWTGLCRYDLKTNKFHRLKTDTKGNGNFKGEGVFSITADKSGKIYFATSNAGVNIYNPKTKKFSYIEHDSTNVNSIPDNFIRRISFDKNGNLWLAHPRNGVSCVDVKTGLCLLRLTEQEKDVNKHLNNNTVRSIFCDSKNRVWISTWSGGFNVYDQNTKTMYTNDCSIVDKYFEQFPNNKNKIGKSHGIENGNKAYSKLNLLRMVYAFIEDAQGNIWLSNIEAGLACYNPETGYYRQYMNNPNNPTSICDNNLLCNFIDRSGQIWVGSLSGGVSILNPHTEKFGYYKTDPVQPGSIPNSQIWSLHKGKYSGKVFIGTKGMVYEFDRAANEFKPYFIDKNGKALLHDQSLCEAIYEDHEGNVWVAVNGAGVFVFNPTKKSVINYMVEPERGGLINHTVSCIYEDANNDIWLGMINGGLELFDRKTNSFIHNYYQAGTDKQYLSSYYVTHISEYKGKLWVATDSGLHILRQLPYEITNFRHKKNDPNSLPDNRINTLFVDRFNTMWLGTPAGLCQYDSKTQGFVNLTKKYNLPATGVTGIAEDLNGFLWLITDRGIARYNKSYHTWKKYDVSEGIQSNDFQPNSIINLPDGYILFGGSKGLNYFLPSKLTQNTIAPDANITNILLRNKAIRPELDFSFVKEITFDYDHFFFDIEFAATDYTNSDKNQYKYKLIGFKDKWIETGNKNSVSFVNLAPGNYTFILAASNNDGVWNEHALELKITITPPFWKTTWFYILCIVFIVIVIYIYIRYRERKLNKEKLILENKVNTRTKELREEKEKVEEAHKEITDSINYAHKIQTALMPGETDFKTYLPDSFVLFQPKDVVSGDFYWINKTKQGDVIYATADCTGHGVPGGFMSMLGTTLLNEIVNEQNINSPDKILNALREKVITALKQTGAEGESKDGMDMTVCVLDQTKRQLKFSGANNPIWVIRNNNVLVELKGDKQPVGFYHHQKEFTLHEIELNPGDTIISFTDGYADQFGGAKGKKFKYSNLQNILLKMEHRTTTEIHQELKRTFDQWKGNLEQTDDVCVIGVRI